MVFYSGIKSLSMCFIHTQYFSASYYQVLAIILFYKRFPVGFIIIDRIVYQLHSKELLRLKVVL